MLNNALRIFCIIFFIITLTLNLFNSSAEDEPTLDINKGSIYINDTNTSGYDQFGDLIVKENSNECHIIGYSETNTITVDSPFCILTLENVSINSSKSCALNIKNNSLVYIIIKGHNYFKSGNSKAGIRVSENSWLFISCDKISDMHSYGTELCGELISMGNNKAAGIGSNNNENSGRISINCGNITAISQNGGAAIGSGVNGNSAPIIINDGNIFANSDKTEHSSSIGNGDGGLSDEIYINSGTVITTNGIGKFGTDPIISDASVILNIDKSKSLFD